VLKAFDMLESRPRIARDGTDPVICLPYDIILE
jgi:hypothetical protein